MDRSPEQKSWELTKPLRLNEDGTSVAALLGSNPDVHYIYVCIKVEAIQIHIVSFLIPRCDCCSSLIRELYKQLVLFSVSQDESLRQKRNNNRVDREAKVG